MPKRKNQAKLEAPKTDRKSAKGSERKPPAFGAGKISDRALGPAAEEIGPELARLAVWVVQQIKETPQRAKFVSDFVKNDVGPRLRHVDPRHWRKPKTLLLEKVLV